MLGIQTIYFRAQIRIQHLVLHMPWRVYLTSNLTVAPHNWEPNTLGIPITCMHKIKNAHVNVNAFLKLVLIGKRARRLTSGSHTSVSLEIAVFSMICLCYSCLNLNKFKIQNNSFWRITNIHVFFSVRSGTSTNNISVVLIILNRSKVMRIGTVIYQ